MRKVEYKPGFYFSNGDQVLEVVNTMPTRPDTLITINEDKEEVRIKEDKLYKIRLDDEWLGNLGFKTEKVFHQDGNLKFSLKKNGPAYYIYEEDLTDGQTKKILVLTVHELQNYYLNICGRVPTQGEPVA